MPTIRFQDTTREISEHFYPKPSKFFIPEWLKNLAPYVDAEKNYSTAKRCLPMMDAVMFGYTMVTTEDIRVNQLGAGMEPAYEWSFGHGIEFHEPEQLITHMQVDDNTRIAKYVSPWTIRTPEGYSCLFVSPLNSDNLTFVPFSGVVDTDTYDVPVAFPFLLSPKDFQGVVPAGTPIAQVIPFRRESWDHVVEDLDIETDKKAYRFVKSMFKNVYRNYFRQEKSFV